MISVKRFQVMLGYIPFVERLWVTSDLGFARLPLRFGAWEGQRAASFVIHTIGTSPGTTESCSENHMVIFEITGNITSGKEGVRNAKFSDIWSTAGQAFWLRSTGEEPSLDECVGPLHGICSSSVCVKRRSERSTRSGVDTATDKVIHIAIVDGLAISGLNGSELGGTLDSAGCGTTVEGSLVCGHLVDTFDDIDLDLVSNRNCLTYCPSTNLSIQRPVT